MSCDDELTDALPIGEPDLLQHSWSQVPEPDQPAYVHHGFGIRRKLVPEIGAVIQWQGPAGRHHSGVKIFLPAGEFVDCPADSNYSKLVVLPVPHIPTVF